MEGNLKDYKYCINLALENAKRRIDLLDPCDRDSVIEEYKECMNDGLSYQSVLLLRDDPSI